MKAIRISSVLIICAFIIMAAGCDSELKDLRIQNDTQRKRISQLDSELRTGRLKLEQLKRELDAIKGREGIEVDSLEEKIAALEKALEDKQALISSMQHQLLYGGAQLPVELSTMLEDFAKSEKMVTYDSSRGIVKFESDLLFKPGSDKVAPKATETVKSLCDILNTEQARGFDIIVAGHTDDIPIGRPATRAKHPTNWHLSAHRAISVLNVMAGNKVAHERMSIRGFGEFRPITPNKPNKKGNQQNRRVEIYIVAKGM